MRIHWALPVVLPVKAGKFYVVTGYAPVKLDNAINDDELTEEARRKLGDLVGGQRARWGKVSFQYARHAAQGGIDVVMVSAAVVVADGEEVKA